MHRHGHIHRDIKTDNFRVHSDKVYLIDFGLETEFMKDGKHIPIEENQQLQGSLYYASTWTHEGRN